MLGFQHALNINCDIIFVLKISYDRRSPKQIIILLTIYICIYVLVFSMKRTASHTSAPVASDAELRRQHDYMFV